MSRRVLIRRIVVVSPWSYRQKSYDWRQQSMSTAGWKIAAKERYSSPCDTAAEELPQASVDSLTAGVNGAKKRQPQRIPQGACDTANRKTPQERDTAVP
jgi:hypothetical protein